MRSTTTAARAATGVAREPAGRHGLGGAPLSPRRRDRRISAAATDPHRQQGAGGPRRLSRRDAAQRLPTAASCSSIAAGSRSRRRARSCRTRRRRPAQVTVHGRLAIPPSGYLELKPEATAGPVRQNLDPARFAAATGLRACCRRSSRRRPRPFPTTGSSARGRRRTSASRPTGSTWCSGTRSRCSPPSLWLWFHRPRRGGRAMTDAVPTRPRCARRRDPAARGARCC